MELHQLLNEVRDADSFLVFARALLESRLLDELGAPDSFGRGPDGWENHTIDGFLEAAISWAEDTQFGASQGLADASPWKRCAVFLYCGKIYE